MKSNSSENAAFVIALIMSIPLILVVALAMACFGMVQIFVDGMLFLFRLERYK